MNANALDAFNFDTAMSREYMEHTLSTFRRSEHDEFISAIWSDVFAEWDCKAPTDEAIKFANEACDRAEKLWKEYHG